MGNSCSSGQTRKDKDNMSQRSEESATYQIAVKKASVPSEQTQTVANNVGQHSGVILEPSTAGQQHLGPQLGEKKTGVSKIMRAAGPSSISADSMSLSSPAGVQSLAETSIPSEVQSLSENLQNLLMGRVPLVKTNVKTKKIVIYILAADSQDCCVEKGALHNTVYPELRQYCRERGYELHIVDLHWKTFLEKQQDHEFPELCLGELTWQSEVAYIIPVLFLNNSLGTPLLPITVESADFEMAKNSAENKSAQTLLSKWYQLDSAAQPPCYRLQPIGSHIPGFKETSAEERERALGEWQTEIERMLAVLVAIFPQELRDSYLTTVVEQEVHNTVFMSQELAKRCIWVNRVYTPTAKTPDNLSPGESELRRRLNNIQRDLKNQLSEKHIIRIPVKYVDGGLNLEIPEHVQYIAQVNSHLLKFLKDSINSIIDEHQTKTMIKPSYGIVATVFEEINQQTSFCQKAAQCNVNREGILNEIKGYITGDNTSPLILFGPGGSGKTTLLAKIAQSCQQWLPEAFVILRFVGISVQSSTIEQLLSSIVGQCSILTYGHQCYCSHNISTYSKILPQLLAASCLQRPLIVLIDGIDQVKPYSSRTIEWLPIKLPENIKLIVSVTENCDLHKQIEAKIKTSGFIRMPLLGESEAQEILMASVMQYNHSVNSKVQDCVLKSVSECTLPLYAKVLAWQTSWWADKEHDIVPKGHVDSQLTQMLEELETIIGVSKAQKALALLTCTKHAITDSEMLDLLAFDEEFHSKATYVVWAPACLTWSRLIKHLAPFLQWTLINGTLGIQWKDNTLLRAVQNRYRSHASWAHQMLHDYYKGKWWTIKPQNLSARLVSQDTVFAKCYNRRKLDELPYQYFKTDKNKYDSCPFVTDLKWIYEKLCGSNCYQVLEDLCLIEKPENDFIKTLKEFLELNTTALNYDGRQFYALLNCFLENRIAKQEIRVEGNKALKDMLEITRNPPVVSLIPLNFENVCDQDKLDSPAPVFETKVFDLVTRLKGTDNFVVSVSTEKEEICVWDVKSRQRVRTMTGITHPINLIPIDQYRCIVLCRRELLIYDLDTGTFVNKLKGVMNQKMPYYGLHDQNHLVALSRNRMYVNLMNLESGDCVTTFKAGEDRFLNSLLVSGDGRVLVCGDETQKPFPLLVWNLKSKKLLYDLRIAHHEFITSLSAITHEGSYVCCVCHEINEPAPNFIVVYDLQSGTLFKKWKPSCNTMSLEISSQGGCVISGLEDARILVWDLITGNCRWSLCGHTAPVSFLRLDTSGGYFLSTDVQCRDRSIRLWDLNKGNLVSVHTPNANITACELTSCGRYIALALEGHKDLITLELRGPDVGAVERQDNQYGAPENHGKVFNLRESETC